MNRIYYLMGAVLLMVLLAMGAYASDVQATTLAQEATPTPADSSSEEAVTTTQAISITVPYLEDWFSSAHADFTAEAFNHWNEDDPQEIPATCARCHSTSGYRDYLGADGTEAGTVDSPHRTGTVIECVACHNDAASNLTSVTFPSGAEITGLGPSARCMVCHQGRASTVDVLNAIDEAGLTDEPDTPSEDLGFINIHYFAAAATLFGSDVSGGFQFADRVYQPKFQHVEGFDSCIKCHNQHTLEIRVDQCATCHDGVSSVEDLRDVRMNGSLKDYDGDGNIEEGIYYEVDGLREMLLQAIQAYADEVVGTPIVYDSASYPYFFIDANTNGALDEGEERYNAWTPHLLEAAYNYQTSIKDPGAFAHNAKYIIELLYDSIDVLNGSLSDPIDLSQAHRDDAGHFNSTAEAFTHFREGEDPMTPATCAKCHNADGLPFYLEHGVTIAMPATDSLQCTTCHEDLPEFNLHQVEEVTFPSGATLSFEDPTSNICLNCHQGRESTFSVNAAIIRSGAGPDDVSDDLRFLNPHYFAAGATLFGSEASGAYQYDDQEYAGRFEHVRRYDTCNECHNVHSLEVNVEDCAGCHEFESLTDIREPDDEPIDFDGDGNTDEGIAGEIQTMHEQLLAAIQDYATNTAGSPIVYASHSYPYWFIDSNENGEADPDEVNSDNQFASWTPTLLQAAYNYQYVAKDPGAFAHNNNYILQILYDSLQSIGGEDAVSGMTRPSTQ